LCPSDETLDAPGNLNECDQAADEETEEDDASISWVREDGNELIR
jgi:hypothetical protein